MNPDQILSEYAVRLALKIIAAGAAEGRLADLAQSQAETMAAEIVEFDEARRRVVIDGPWPNRPQPDQPGAA